MTLTLETDSGQIFLHEIKLAPLRLPEFIDALFSKGINYEDCTPNQGWRNIGFPVNFYGKKFSFIITFHNDLIYSLYLSWHEGVSGKMGYEVSERDLNADYQTLIKFLEKLFNDKAQKEGDHIANFYFEWGKVTTNYSIRSLTVGISITWYTCALGNQILLPEH